MSHVVRCGSFPLYLEHLKAACEKLGLALEAAETYKWYGRHVGDYPLPAGFKVEDLGRCEFKISCLQGGYEIGVVGARDEHGNAQEGYTLLFDFWGRPAIQKIAGERGEVLMAEYVRQMVHSVAGNQYNITEFEEDQVLVFELET